MMEIIALELTDDASSVFEFKPPRRCALVLGNEVSGISLEALERCKKRVVVPMSGRKGSLNVSEAVKE
jgi:tRNA G18 (ribose-2'-O)-methylase SpoU